jgi:hypothetical protein
VKVSFGITLEGVDYNALVSNTTLFNNFKGAIKTEIASAIEGVETSDVSLLVSEGSVAVQAFISTPESSVCGVHASTQAALSQDTLAAAVTSAVASLDGIESASSGNHTTTVHNTVNNTSSNDCEASTQSTSESLFDQWYNTLSWWQWALFGIGSVALVVCCCAMWIAFCCERCCCRCCTQGSRRRGQHPSHHGGHHWWEEDLPQEPKMQIHDRVRAPPGQGASWRAASPPRSPRNQVQPAPLHFGETPAGHYHHGLPFMHDRVRQETVRALFSPGRLGLFINHTTDCVDNVEIGEQAAYAGVQVGWKLQSIDNRPYNARLLESKVMGNSQYEVVFVKAYPGRLPVGNQEFTL